MPARPLPLPDPDSAPFWESIQRKELAIQRCRSCQHWIHFPAPICPACGSAELSFERVSGLGVVYTYTVVHRAISEAFASLVPYVVAWIELPEQPGLRMVSNIVDWSPDDVQVGS